MVTRLTNSPPITATALTCNATTLCTIACVFTNYQSILLAASETRTSVIEGSRMVPDKNMHATM